jgi:predicted ATP-dependent serine protease
LAKLNEIDDLRIVGLQLTRDQTPDVDEYISRLDELRTRQHAELGNAGRGHPASRRREAKPGGSSSRRRLKPLDDLLGGGLKSGQLVVVGGRPGSGKSVLMLQMLLGSV